MCGFVGLLGAAPLTDDQRRRCRDALGSLRHRGPDHVGARSFDRAGLTHARLAVIDPGPASHQPVADVTGRWWCVHNGEIYSFPELRRELEGRGAPFATRGDAEVVLEAFKAWGTGCQRRFNGMWAFAVPWRDWLGRPTVRCWVLDLVRSPSFLQSHILDGAAVATRVETMLGRGPTAAEAYELWPVLNVFLWNRRFSGAAVVGRGGRPAEPW